MWISRSRIRKMLFNTILQVVIFTLGLTAASAIYSLDGKSNQILIPFLKKIFKISNAVEYVCFKQMVWIHESVFHKSQ